MHEPLVSVIVPIYKTEDYLDQCIRSIVGQSYSNLEIILVDDGSPDGCPAMCDSWAKRDSRIKVIHKPNSGVGDARNAGISMAEGKYLTFADSDDYLEPDAIRIMAGYAQQYQAQCVAGGFKRLLRDGSFIEKAAAAKVKFCDDRQKVEENILYRLIGAEYKSISPLSQSACVKLYDRQLLAENEVKFLPIREIGSEDFYFNICFFEHVEKAVIIPETFYVYRDNGTSCSNTYQAERLESFLRLYRQMEQKTLLRDTEMYQQMLAANILGGISVCIKLLIASNAPDKMRELTQVLEKEEIRRMLQQCKLSEVRFPLSLFCVLMKYRMKHLLYCLISLFVKLSMDRK